MTTTVPVVDLSVDSSRATRDLVEAVAAGARDYGFFQVVGHGVPEELVARVWGETRRFFALPVAAKQEVARTKTNPRGYYDRELTKNRRDLKEVFDFARPPRQDLPDDHPDNRADVDGANQWPSAHPALRPTLLEYLTECERVAFRLLELLALGLGLDGDPLRAHFTPRHTAFARLNYYPLDDPLDPGSAAAVTPLGDMALHHHSDAGALTILLQDDVGGLQVQVGERWVEVTPIHGALVVNVGDMLRIWSNDRYRAAVHRVRPVTDRPRYSLPFFFNPAYEANVLPLVIGEQRPRYRSVNWGAFRQARTDGDYADYGHEIQIADFRREEQ